MKWKIALKAIVLGAAVLLLAVAAEEHLGATPVQARGGETAGVSDIFLTERSARDLGVKDGDFLELSAGVAGPWQRVRVARVYRPVLYPSELAAREIDVRLHLPDLQALQGGADNVDSIVVRLRHPGRAEEVAARLNASALGFRTYSSADLARRSSSTFAVVAQFHRAIGVVTVLASGAFLLAIMTLKGEEMRRHVALLRLLGISHATVAGAILLIATAVALAGSAVGIGLGYALSWMINAYYRSLFDTGLTFSQITPSLLGLAAALSVVLGIGAGAMTLWRLLRGTPVDQMGR